MSSKLLVCIFTWAYWSFLYFKLSGFDTEVIKLKTQPKQNDLCLTLNKQDQFNIVGSIKTAKSPDLLAKILMCLNLRFLLR